MISVYEPNHIQKLFWLNDDVKSINILKESQIPELTENVIPIVEKF